MNYIILPFTFIITIITWIMFIPITFVINFISNLIKPLMIGYRLGFLYRKLRSKIGN